MKHDNILVVDGYEAIVATLKKESRNRFDYERRARKIGRDLTAMRYIVGSVHGGGGRRLAAKGLLTITVRQGYSYVELTAVENDRLLRIARRLGWRHLHIDRLIGIDPVEGRINELRDRVEEVEMLEMWGECTKQTWLDFHRQAIKYGDYALARRIGSIINVVYDDAAADEGLTAYYFGDGGWRRRAFASNYYDLGYVRE